MSKFDGAEEITNQIIVAIESGLADGSKWVMPWHSNGTLAMPINALTKKSYRGGNIVALWARGKTCDYSSGYWATFKQWKELGATIKKGSKGSMVVFWKKFRVGDPAGSEEAADGARDDTTGKTFMKSWTSRVFNADQVVQRQ
ncbi:ArdC-like ssDNA-binding domain-containing protein [Kiloniella sp.]|uniref:ArdC-like ssDNA-binding domain-containing protein n=1 Tax=Kiloniella sp. TaxID=1938587 RepID=UPI003B02104E